MIVLDTSAIVAAYDSAQPQHKRIRAFLDSDTALVTSPFVLAEVDYLITTRVNAKAAITVLRELDGFVSLARLNGAIMNATYEVMEQYQDLALGLTDASLVAISADVATTQLLTLDLRHFRAVRPLMGAKHFTILPDDQENAT